MKTEDVIGLFEVTGKVALITGASGAFGSVAAKALAAAGAKGHFVCSGICRCW